MTCVCALHLEGRPQRHILQLWDTVLFVYTISTLAAADEPHKARESKQQRQRHAPEADAEATASGNNDNDPAACACAIVIAAVECEENNEILRLCSNVGMLLMVIVCECVSVR